MAALLESYTGLVTCTTASAMREGEHASAALHFCEHACLTLCPVFVRMRAADSNELHRTACVIRGVDVLRLGTNAA